MKYKVYLSTSIMGIENGEFWFETDNTKELTPRIMEELRDRKLFKDGYWRYTALDNAVSIDFGSWTRFVVIEGANFGTFFVDSNEEEEERLR